MTVEPSADLWPSKEYHEWNSLLVDELFPSGRPGVPVYLAVHDGLLNECGARNGRGGRDQFVGAVLNVCTSSLLFIGLGLMAKIWNEKGRGGVPPFVAGLGLAVLAAGDMATDETATQANYYVRLNKLLGVESRTRPEGFECTHNLWRLLREWLRDERRGELTVRGMDSAHPFVNPVQSQCLVRACDVDELASLFRQVRVEPGQFIEPEDVVPVLRAWLSSTGARSRLARLLGRDASDAALQQAAEALCDAIEECSIDRPATIEDARASQPVRALLAIRPNRYPNLMWKRAEWLLRLTAQPGASEPECLIGIGSEVAIGRLDVREPAGYDAPITPAQAAQLLRRQLRVVDEDGSDVTPTLRFPAWFQDGSLHGRPGSWDIIERPSASAAHALVLAESNLFEQVRSQVDQAPPLMAGDADTWPGPGLYAACPVTLREGAVLPGGIAVQSIRSTLRLSGGLAIHRHVYLRGALPGIVGPDAASLAVRYTDQPDISQVVTCAGLRVLDLPEGRYGLSCGDATTEIFVVEPRWRECLVPKQAPLDQEVHQALRDAAVRGACIVVERPIYTTYFRPGTHFRIYQKLQMLKGVAPVDGGLYEIITPQSPNHVVIKRRPAAPPCLPRAGSFQETARTETAGYSDLQRIALERLLDYLSARGTGSIDVLREHCASIAGETASWHSALSTLEDLGHIDVNWESRRWTAAPATIAAKAIGGGSAILAGARARETLTSLKARGIHAAPDERALDAHRSIMPACVLIHLETAICAIPELSELGVRVASSSPALDLAPHVRPLSETSWWTGPQFSPSSRVRQTLERWNSVQLRWTNCEVKSEFGGPALYRWREHGLVVHYVVSESLRARVRDPAAAKWNLAPSDRSHLVYEPEAGRLLIPAAMGLPRIWKRICTIASGLMPLHQERLLVYEDIPLDLARTMAIRLNQTRAEGLS